MKRLATDGVGPGPRMLKASINAIYSYTKLRQHGQSRTEIILTQTLQLTVTHNHGTLNVRPFFDFQCYEFTNTEFNLRYTHVMPFIQILPSERRCNLLREFQTPIYRN